MGLGVVQYAAISRDLPPSFREPGASQSPWEFGWGPIGNGNWFEHNWLYSFAVTALLGETKFALGAGRPAGSVVTREINGQRVSVSDCTLTNTLYAHPNFFDWNTQSGPSQFGPQALTSIAHPSSKGILSQNRLFHYPEYGEVVACCAVDLPSPVVFADMSTTESVMKRMPRGILNVWDNVNVAPGSNPRTMPGRPVVDTHRGILGRDR